ncbi:MAG TPA: glycoside hydrolase [Chloroflexota bacterium]|nr:glycoside hydrolase [Chloroflexota bacterium]
MPTITVDAKRPLGPLPRPWTTFGYDELNWTYTPRGKRALKAFAQFAERPYHVRAHNLLTSGRGFSWPHWGSGNVYHEDAAGNPYYDWTTVDLVFDAYREVGFKPLVELGFTPKPLVPDGPESELPFTRSPSQYGPYEAYQWSLPPKDYAKWEELMFQLARHCVERYGADEVATWYWELWNEPDITYWRGTVEQFCDLYDRTVAGLSRALPGILVGGPAVTGGERAVRFMETFLAHCATKQTRLDFITFHTKGSAFGRSYAPLSDDGARFDWGPNDETKGRVPRRSPSRKKMLSEIRAHLRAAARHPQFRNLPVIVDECDPCVPAHFSRYDDPNFGFRNTSYYPTIMASVFKRLMDLNESLPDAPDVTLATAWSFYFEGERFFEGFREFFTAENVELPVLNGYRLLGKLGGTRLALTSDATWDINTLDALPGPEQDNGRLADQEVDGLAAIDEQTGAVTVALWFHADDQYAAAPAAAVTLALHRLPFDPARATVRHWRIDETHSNAHTVWQQMGRPQDPTPEQLAALKARQGLEEGEVVQLTPAGDGAQVRLHLPLHSLSLLEVSPGRS